MAMTGDYHKWTVDNDPKFWTFMDVFSPHWRTWSKEEQRAAAKRYNFGKIYGIGDMRSYMLSKPRQPKYGARVVTWEHGRFITYWNSSIERGAHVYRGMTRCPWCFAFLSASIPINLHRCPNCRSLMRK